MAPYLGLPDPWPRRVAEVLPFNPADDSETLFRIRVRLIRSGVFRHRHLTAKELSERHPGRLIDLLEAHLDRRHAEPAEADNTADDERGFPHHLPLHEAEHLDAVADALARPFWERLAPLVVRSCEATREQEGRRPSPFFKDRTWSADHWRFAHSGNVELLRFVARAGGRQATENPPGFASEYATWLNHPGQSVQRMAGLALAEAGEAAADVAVHWLCDNPHRFLLPDDSGRRWGIARRVIARHGVSCSAAMYDRLEQTILCYHDAEERRSMEYHLHEARGGWLARPNRWGLTQHALLPCLPAGRLGVRARSEMGVLARKFDRPAEEVDPGPVVRMGEASPHRDPGGADCQVERPRMNPDHRRNGETRQEASPGVGRAFVVGRHRGGVQPAAGPPGQVGAGQVRHARPVDPGGCEPRVPGGHPPRGDPHVPAEPRGHGLGSCDRPAGHGGGPNPSGIGRPAAAGTTCAG